MRKVLLSALLLPSLAMFLLVDPAYPQICAPVVTGCYPGPPGDPEPFTCFSDNDVGSGPGAPCRPLTGGLTLHVCTGPDPWMACCACRPRYFATITYVFPDPATFEPLVWISSAVGLQSVSVYSGQNVRVEIPEFEPGIFTGIIVAVHKIDPLKSASFRLQVCDSDQCRVLDPVDTLVVREAGKPATQRFTDLPFEESHVQILNHDPGVKHLEIGVNGKRYQVVDLESGEYRVLDIASAMEPGEQNVVTLKALGKPGGTVTVLIHD